MEHVWTAFQALSSTRNSGMSVGPITYLEVMSYRAATLSDITAWEISVIMRMDLKVRSVLSDQSLSKGQGAPDNEVYIDDKARVRSLLSRVRDRFVGKK
jgi:hypothetical protein